MTRDWRSEPATEKQKNFALDLGVYYRLGMTKGELSDLIDDAIDERDDKRLKARARRMFEDDQIE